MAVGAIPAAIHRREPNRCRHKSRHRSGRQGASRWLPLLEVTAGNAFNATLYDNLSFNFIRDIAPIASISRTPFVMEVNPSVPVKTVPEFIVYAKANPGKINMASN